jgi:hypothetical protein
MSLSQPVPLVLDKFSPILQELGLKWSDHYRPPGQPEKCWGIVNAVTGRAGRVGMTIEEAEQDVLDTVRYRLRKYRGLIANEALRLRVLASELQDKLI